MTREAHLCASKWARLRALKEKKITGIITIDSGSKSLECALKEMCTK